MENVLDLLDQSTFDLDRMIDITTLLQCVWVYDGRVDIDGLRRFHGHLQRGPLSRAIERSSLRFGRHRWISCDGVPELEIASARPREQFESWLVEQVNIPLDCERGPGWHLALLPFTQGGAGLSLVIPHCLTDGMGLCMALGGAACGRDDPMSWPAAASRRRWQALRKDTRQAARDIPAIGRGVAAALRIARDSRRSPQPATPLSTWPEGVDEPITLPTSTVFIDVREWDARAQALGGTSNTLLVGIAARLAQEVERVAVDGSVFVGMPVDKRITGDTRANAYDNVGVTVDPAPASTDLREMRAAVKQALIRHSEVRDDPRAAMACVPLLGLVPKRFLRRSGGSAAIGINASNLGVIDPAVCQPDGTNADYFAMRLLYKNMTRARVHRAGGLQWFVSGRTNRYVFISATAYQPGRSNSAEVLRQNLSRVLGEFSLIGTYLPNPMITDQARGGTAEA